MQIERIHPDYRSVWEAVSEEQRRALSAYFLPLKSTAEFLEPTRPKMIKWYCPFASQARFPSGHRYCVNVYAGICAHNCLYCYAMQYQRGQSRPKADFCRLVDRDIADLERFGVAPAPIHLSNSTDPFQELERKCGHTRYLLDRILGHRQRFTTVTILTKNPLLAVQQGYVSLFRELIALPPGHARNADFTAQGVPAFQIHVSLAFWRDEARAVYEPCAPSVSERVEGLWALREAGIPIVLRIDPLFPRSPLPLCSYQSLRDYGLAEAQTLEDLEQLVNLARSLGAGHVVYSPMKIVCPRGRQLHETMQSLLRVYRESAAPGRPEWRGGSWRLPAEIAAQHVVGSFRSLCEQMGVPAKFCMRDLMETP
jgi:DNA repair photolyase